MTGRLRWTFGVVFVVLAVGYFIGGTRGYVQAARTIRLWVQTMFEPPTEREAQRAAVRDSMARQAMTKEIQMARERMPAGQPASRAKVVSVNLAIFGVALGLMYLSSRGDRRRRH